MSTEPNPRRGPLRLGSEETAAFLARRRLGAMCVEDGSGALVAVPVRMGPLVGTDDRLPVVAADPAVATAVPGTRPTACVVADEFETYEGIRGVIAQGEVHPGVPSGSTSGTTSATRTGDFHLEIRRLVGFTFEGTLPPQLGGAGADAGGG